MLDTSSDEEEPKPENEQHTTKPDEKEETKLTASTIQPKPWIHLQDLVKEQKRNPIGTAKM